MLNKFCLEDTNTLPNFKISKNLSKNKFIKITFFMYLNTNEFMPNYLLIKINFNQTLHFVRFKP